MLAIGDTSVVRVKQKSLLWRLLSIGIGLLLIVLGIAVPISSNFQQTGINVVSTELLVQGEWLFKYGLIANGILIVVMSTIAARLTRSHADAPPLYRFEESSPAPHVGIRWLLAAIIAVALVLRLIGLGGCLWYDEVVTLTAFVRLPFAELVRTYSDQNQHPLYSIMAHASVITFGESAWSLRLPAVLFGLASLWALYDFTKRMAPWPEPLLAVLLLALSYHHVWFSQNARGYTGLMFFTMLGSSLFVQNLQNSRPWRCIAYSICMSLGLYTHQTAIFVVAAHGLIFLVLLARRVWIDGYLRSQYIELLASFVLIGMLTFQLYALVLPQVVDSFQRHIGGQHIQPWTRPSWAIMQFITAIRLSFLGSFGVVACALVVLVGMVSYARRNALVISMLLISSLLGMTAMLVLHRHLYPRYLFILFGFGAMILVRGTMCIGEEVFARLSGREATFRRLGGVLAASAMIVVSAITVWHCYQYPKQDYIAAVSYVNAARSQGDPVVTAGMATIPLKRYYAPDIAVVHTASELQNIRNENATRPVWFIYTFPDQLEFQNRDIWQVIKTDFVRTKTFPGTLSNGALIVCRSNSTDSLPIDKTSRSSESPQVFSARSE